jgi:predicted kinase
MTPPLLLIITGAPGAGKTTLGRRLARDLRLPMLSKDDIKESLFDSLGWGDAEWGSRLGVASFQLLHRFLEIELEAGRPLIVEGNFQPAASTARFAALLESRPFQPFQLLCAADPGAVLERYGRRWERGERHPGHNDPQQVGRLAALLAARAYGFMELPGPRREVDTTTRESVNYEGVLAAIRPLLRSDTQAG